jgi:hypothetical protein
MTLNGKWMEVFRAGDYGPKGKFTAADLDKIIANYDPAKHEAPLTIGHPEHDAPAYGWAEALRRTGDVLFAKLKQVPDAIDHLVSEGRFKKRSISLYNGANGPSLRHIGLLGAMPPEVKGLADLKLCEFGQDKFESFDFKEEGLTIEEMKAAFSEAIRNLFGDKARRIQRGRCKEDLARSCERSQQRSADEVHRACKPNLMTPKPSASPPRQQPPCRARSPSQRPRSPS